MISTRPATAPETEAWLSLWRERWESEHARTGTEPNTDARVKRHTDSPDATVLRLIDGVEPVGFLAMSTVSDYGAPSAVLDDIYVDQPHRRRGIGRAALRLAEDWARPRSSRLRARTSGVNPAQSALVKEYAQGGQGMIKDLTEPPALPPGVSVRPMTQAEYEPWYDIQVVDYGQSFVDSGILEPAEAQVRAAQQSAQLLPEGLATPAHEILTLLADGQTAGSIWLYHRTAPDTSFVYGVEVDADKRGRGLGRAVMQAGEVATLAAGNHRLGLHVFGHNTVAVRLYESLGYQVVDQSWSLTF